MIVKSLDHLTSLSKKVAENLSENDLIYLVGEIGVGKTTFARSLINYLQSKQGLNITEVPSPTFNLLYEYNLKKFKIMHYDLYRIKEEKELINLGLFSDEQDSIKIIEWPNLIKTSFSNKLEIHIGYGNKDNENEREINLIGKGKWENFK